MWRKASRGKLLYQEVRDGNAEGIRALHLQGANLEWIDKEGKTPLILACTSADRYDIAKLLIELGSNVNAYRPGSCKETPLYHAAIRGLVNTVKLLLLHGGKWVVIVPTSSSSSSKLFVYTSLQDALPQSMMSLSVARLVEPKAWQSISVTITDRERSLQLAPAIEGDRQQLKWFCDACKGFPQVSQPPVVLQTPSAPPLTDDVLATMEKGLNHYPSVNSTHVDVPSFEDRSSRKCAICLDATPDAACDPCGHVAGCISCLKKIKSKKWGCPICRAAIRRVLKLYHV